MTSPKILFYCHNLFGLGHIRRSTRLASACADSGAVCSVVTGCRSLSALYWDERIVLHDLPALAMGPDQQFYEAGHPERTDVMERRAKRIFEVVRECPPDVLVVDYLPGGLGGELLGLGGEDSPLPKDCRIVWGVPYTKRISRPTSRPRNPRIRRWMDRFDSVLAYTDPAWEDPLAPLVPGGLPEEQAYSGFITGSPAATMAGSREVVVLAGGGREALQIAPLIHEALARLVLSERIRVRCVVGPLGEVESVREKLSDVAEIVPSASVEEAVAGAAVIVSRCGYNSAYTLLRSEAPIIFLPQISPCFEQLDRSARLAAIERVTVVREDADGAAAQLRQAVEEGLELSHQSRDLPFSIKGDQVAAEWLLDRK